MKLMLAGKVVPVIRTNSY